MFPEIPVIGGPGDGQKCTTSPAVVSLTIEGHQYIKLEFKHDNRKRFIYMAAGMTPAAAAALWRERYEKTVKTPEK